MSRKTVTIAGIPHAVGLTRRGDDVTATVDDTAVALTVQREGTRWRVARDGPDGRSLAATVIRDRDTVWIAIDGEIHG